MIGKGPTRGVGSLHALFRGLLLAAPLACAMSYAADGATVWAQAQNGRRTLLSSPSRAPGVVARRRGRSGRRAARPFVLLRGLGNVNSLGIKSVESQPDTSGPRRERFFESPEWRRNWFLFQRSFPNDSLPTKGRSYAFARAEGLLQGALPLASPTPPITQRWRSVGPAPITPKFPSMGVTGGRLSAIAVSPADPRIILVGSATGGIWRSADGGATFAPVSDNHVDLAVGSLAFAPSDPSIAYAGMGDVASGYMGTGVLKSTDGGATWSRVSGDQLPAPGTVVRIVVDPSNPERVYAAQYAFRAATGEGEVYASGFFLSEDGGKNWESTKTCLPRDLVHHPTRPRTLYLSVSNAFSETPPSAGVYRSTDGGETWDPVFTPPHLNVTDIKIAVTPAAPETIYVFTGRVTQEAAEVSVHVSRNGGQDWSVVNGGGVDVGQFGYNSYVAADPADPQTLYLGTRDLWKSSDGGETWKNLTNNWIMFADGFGFSPWEATAHTDQHALAFSPGDPQTLYIGNDGGLSRSRDGGRTFESLNATLSTSLLNSVTLRPGDASVSCAGSQDNGVLIRAPGRAEWREFESGDSGRCLIRASDPDTIFSSYIFGTLFRFKRNGDEFIKTTIATEAKFQEPSRNPRISFYPPFAIDQSSGALYFGTWRLFVSTDQGTSWKKLAAGKDLTHGRPGPGETDFGDDVLSAIGIGPAGSGVLYTGSAQGRLMFSDDGGKNWDDVTKGLPRRFVTSVVVDGANGKRAYVTFSGFGSGHVFRTVNGGADWVNISQTLPNVPVNTLLVDPLAPEVIYAGTDIGVFRTLDGGSNWGVFNFGLPPVIVTGFSAQPSGALQIATYGRGVYELIR